MEAFEGNLQKDPMDRLETLAEVGREISAMLDPEAILEYLLDTALAATGGESGSVMLLDEETEELYVRVHRGLRGEFVHARRKLGEGISGWVAKHNQPMHLVRAVRDERFEGVYADEEIKDAICAPLVHRGRVVGVISANHHTDRAPFTEEDLRLLVALGGYAAVAIRNAEAFRELEERRKLQEHLLSTLLTAHEDERKRIAADIHDGPAQAIAALQRQAEMCEKLLDSSPERARVELYRLQESIREALLSLRRILVELRPSLLDDIGLIPALRQHLEGFRVHTGVDARFESPVERVRLDPAIETVVYRVVQEALNNVARHSGASRVGLRMAIEGDWAIAEIKDNGKGFEATRARKGECLGIAGMEERAKMVGGELIIESQPGEGTRVVLRVPVSPTAPMGYRLADLLAAR